MTTVVVLDDNSIYQRFGLVATLQTWQLAGNPRTEKRGVPMHVQHFVSEDSFDADYQFGHPKTYLAPIELARATILRSRLGDTPAERAAEHIEFGQDEHASHRERRKGGDCSA